MTRSSHKHRRCPIRHICFKEWGTSDLRLNIKTPSTSLLKTPSNYHPEADYISNIRNCQPNPAISTNMDASRLTGSAAVNLMKSGDLTVENYAKELLARIEKRDEDVKAWAYLDKDLILSEAKRRISLPFSSSDLKTD